MWDGGPETVATTQPVRRSPARRTVSCLLSSASLGSWRSGESTRSKRSRRCRRTNANGSSTSRSCTAGTTSTPSSAAKSWRNVCVVRCARRPSRRHRRRGRDRYRDRTLTADVQSAPGRSPGMISSRTSVPVPITSSRSTRARRRMSTRSGFPPVLGRDVRPTSPWPAHVGSSVDADRSGSGRTSP